MARHRNSCCYWITVVYRSLSIQGLIKTVPVKILSKENGKIKIKSK